MTRCFRPTDSDRSTLPQKRFQLRPKTATVRDPAVPGGHVRHLMEKGGPDIAITIHATDVDADCARVDAGTAYVIVMAANAD